MTVEVEFKSGFGGSFRTRTHTKTLLLLFYIVKVPKDHLVLWKVKLRIHLCV